VTATFSFNTWNHSGRWGLAPTLPDQIAAAAGAGYAYVGLDVPSLLAHEEQGLAPEQIRDCLSASAIECFELVPLPISADRGSTRQGLARVSRLGPLLGARQVLAVLHGPPTTAALAEVRRCAEALAESGIGTSIEFLPNLEVNSIDAVLRIIDAVEHPQLRMVVDSWHFFAGTDTWATLDAIPAERLGFVQFSDAGPVTNDDTADQYCHHRVLPGQGSHDLDGFSQRVLARWPDVVVSVEVLSSPWRSQPVQRFATETFRATEPFWRER
jgi:sugar phosphate isomerase/epimerase